MPSTDEIRSQLIGGGGGWFTARRAQGNDRQAIGVYEGRSKKDNGKDRDGSSAHATSLTGCKSMRHTYTVAPVSPSHP
jgi:hypothetical protein